MTANLQAKLTQIGNMVLDQGKLEQALALVQRLHAAEPDRVEWADLMHHPGGWVSRSSVITLNELSP